MFTDCANLSLLAVQHLATAHICASVISQIKCPFVLLKRAANELLLERLLLVSKSSVWSYRVTNAAAQCIATDSYHKSRDPYTL